GSMPAAQSSSSGEGGGSVGPRYHEVRAKSAHNAYERNEAVFDQLVYHRVRSLEFDIHTDKLGWPSPSGDWYVYHDTLSSKTTCHRLSDCLRELRAFHDAVPAHEVISLILDVKSDFKTGQEPADLDALISSTFPNNMVYRPADALGACPAATSLRDAVAGACRWPSLASLRGKLLILLTGGDSCTTTSHVTRYAANATETSERSAFIAPNIHALCPWSSYANARDHIACFNMAALDAGHALDVQQAGLVGRVWGINTATSWGIAFNNRAQLLSTDKVNADQDPWAKTHNKSGWPFECFSECSAPADETGQLLTVEVSSGDIYNQEDSAYFLRRDVTTTSSKASAWAAYLATPNSHVEPWAKGCLIARRGDHQDAANFAVCRPADVHRIRVQVRANDGDSTQSYDGSINPANTIDDPSAAFLRLEVEPGAKTFRGMASQDGKTWVLIHEQTFAQPLYLQGIAASSHDSGTVRFAFGNLTRSISGETPVSQPMKDLTAVPIGAQASGSAHDGF
ncbi:MAG: Ca2+-dependent phosphoinositide-specific phospholipase C, partial [Polyangiaceae bacterium]